MIIPIQDNITKNTIMMLQFDKFLCPISLRDRVQINSKLKKLKNYVITYWIDLKNIKMLWYNA